MRIRKAVIPAAGLGTRFLPATKAQPKEMLPIVDTPTIQYVIEEAVASGIEDILIITGRGKRAIEDHFDRAPDLEELLLRQGRADLLEEVRRISALADLHFVRQKEPLGLGHAVLQARRHVGDEPFAVLLADDLIDAEVPALAQMLARYRGGGVVAVERVPRERISAYGIIDPGRSEGPLHEVRDLVEKPPATEAPSDLGVVGRYLLDPEIFDILAALEPGVGGEIQLTDALRLLNRRKPLYALEFTGRRYDIGEKTGFIQATVDLALKRPELRSAVLEYLRRILAEVDGMEEAAGTRE